MTSPLRVAIAGLGVVGGGVANLLAKNAATITKRTGGRSVEVVAFASGNSRSESQLREDFGEALHGSQFFSDSVAMAQSRSADVVVEAIRGDDVALKVSVEALKNGANLVTANKAMLAVHGETIANLAESSSKNIGWEAAVGGGIPCIRSLKDGMAADQLEYAAGILNGTCNFILTTMKETGRQFEDVLDEAQRLGYAESPPDLDVDGIDTAHKLSLVAALCTGCKPNFGAVHIEGIRHVAGSDVMLAEKLGFAIKLLGVASKGSDGTVLQRVHPSLVPLNTSLGSTHGVLNCLFSVGKFAGPIFTQGPGAGRNATAAAICSDIVEIARGNGTPTFGIPFEDLGDMKTATMLDARVGKYFVRCEDHDAEMVKQTLGKNSIEVLESETAEGYTGLIVEDTQESRILNEFRDGHANVGILRVEGPW